MKEKIKIQKYGNFNLVNVFHDNNLVYVFINKYNKDENKFKYNIFDIDKIKKDDVLFNRYELIKKFSNEV